MDPSESGRRRVAPSEMMARQAPLATFARSARKFAEQHGISGFQQANLDNDEFSVIVIWHGPRSAEFDEFVAARPVDFPVHIVDSPYTRVELMAEALRVMKANPGILDSVGPTARLTGLRAGVNVTRAPLDVHLDSEYPIERHTSGGVIPLGG
jgi:hypothetical protein